MNINLFMTEIEKLNLHEVFSNLEINNLTSSCLLKIENVNVNNELTIKEVIDKITDFRFTRINSSNKTQYEAFKQENKFDGDMTASDWNTQKANNGITIFKNKTKKDRVVHLGIYINTVENYICIQGTIYK